MVARTKRTIEERIAETEVKLKALQEEERKIKVAKKSVLTKESAGVAELLNQIDSVAKQNGVKTVDVIKAVAKLKRTGLVIEHRSTRFDDVMAL